MKKFTIWLCCVFLALSLSACTPNDDEIITGENDGLQDTTVDSYIKADVEYDSYIPTENAVLSFAGTVLEHVQHGKILYILTDGALYSFDTESGESKQLIESDHDCIAICSEILYLYNSERGEISSYSLSGELLDSFASEELKDWNVKSFVATDSYFVFLRFRYQTENNPASYQIATVNKNTKDIIAKDIKAEYEELCSYKSDELLAVYVDGLSSEHYLYSFDAKSGDLKKIRRIMSDAFSSFCYDICYNPKTDSAVLVSFSGVPTVWEYSLGSDDNTVLCKIEEAQELFVSVYENAVSVMSDGCEYKCFDYLNPPESITVAYTDAMGFVQNDDLEKIIHSYEAERGVLVRLQVYTEDEELLKIKLMAGDSDIDVFSTMSVGESYCIRSNAYVDLSKFDSLGKKISSDIFTDFASKTGEEYFGIPYGISYDKNAHENPGKFTAIEQYCIKNINSETGEYLDPDGDELYKVLKYHYDNPKGSDEEFYDFPYSTIQTDYLIMNPASEKQELAADFLEYFFDVMNGDIKLTAVATASSDIFSPFIELESADDVYLTWKFQADGVIPTIYNAYHESLKTDGSNKALKELAKEGARSYRMRLEG